MDFIKWAETVLGCGFALLSYAEERQAIEQYMNWMFGDAED